MKYLTPVILVTFFLSFSALARTQIVTTTCMKQKDDHSIVYKITVEQSDQVESILKSSRAIINGVDFPLNSDYGCRGKSLAAFTCLHERDKTKYGFNNKLNAQFTTDKLSGLISEDSELWTGHFELSYCETTFN